MTNSMMSKVLNNVDEDDGGTDHVTCPLLELINSKPKNLITNRLGQKARYLKHINDNQPLIKNKTAEADLEDSFKLMWKSNITKKRDLLQNTPIVCPALKNQNYSNFKTPNNTFVNLKRKIIRKLNFKPTLPLSTKRYSYNDKDVPEQKNEKFKTAKSKMLTQSHIGLSSCLLTAKENIKEMTKKSLMNVYDDIICYELPDTFRNNHDSSLYFNTKNTTSLPELSNVSSSIKISNSLDDSSLFVEQLECQYLDNGLANFTQTVVPVEEYLIQPVNYISNMCITCASDNFISIKGTNYCTLNILGHGGSSVVYEALYPETNRVVAIKKVDLSGVEDIIAKGYLNEVTLLKNLQDCKSVIRLIDSEYITEEKILYMVMEKGDTDLSNLIRNTKNMSVHMIMYYWSEMLTTVHEIHARGIIHSDLKPANFLLVSGRLKLIDFGIASKIQGDMTSVLKDMTAGTWNYMSPECIRNGDSDFHGHKINQKSDVWSLGCILYSLVYDKTPFSHLTSTWEKLHAIGDFKQNICFPSYRETFKHGIPPVLMQAMKLCLSKDVKSRPSVVDLLSLMENTVFKSIGK